jgi:hypothetical protein
MKPDGILEWNLDLLAESLKIDVESVKTYFQDGRRISFLLERRINNEILGGKLAPSEGASFDVYDTKGFKWEVRSITHGGTYFGPSKDVGSGRSFSEANLKKKLSEIEGYILCDIVKFPQVPFWKVNSKSVLSWYENGLLGKNAQLARNSLLAILSR